MTLVPATIAEYTEGRFASDARLAWFVLDEEGRIRQQGGDAMLLNPSAASEGNRIAHHLIFMENLLPLPEERLVLPNLRYGKGAAVDAHLFRIAGGYGLLLLDASAKAQRQQACQQQANEQALLQEKYSRELTLHPRETGAMASCLEELLTVMNIVVLQRHPGDHFSLMGSAPPWLARFCPQGISEALTSKPDSVFTFLGNFMQDAIGFWSKGRVGSIKSGLWTETDDAGQEHLLEATAVISADGGQFLLIACNHESFSEKRTIIQKGRNLALDYQALMRLEKEVAGARDELEHRVLERTAELENANRRLAEELTQRKHIERERAEIAQQLQQAQKMEAIGTLAGGIAHDFNNILSAVIGFSEISMIDMSPDSQLFDNLQHVLKAANRARDLVKQILTFSHQTQEERQPIQLKPIIIETLKLIRPSLPTTIEIQSNLNSKAWVLADPGQIHQVMMNLCTNAGHAMAGKGGVLSIRLDETTLGPAPDPTHPELPPGLYARLTVSDTGKGIAAEHLERIFDPFFTTKGKDQGTGMGLAMVHGIVQTCKGVISVNTQTGEGTEFSILLPAKTLATIHETVIDDSPTEGHERILFVDDERFLTDLANHMLPNLGYQVITVNDSAEALQVFSANPDAFDLMITDMTMPKMTGIQLAEAALKIRPDLPIILCSGYSDAISPTETNAMGIRDYVLKPAGMKEIAERIRKALDPL